MILETSMEVVELMVVISHIQLYVCTIILCLARADLNNTTYVWASLTRT